MGLFGKSKPRTTTSASTPSPSGDPDWSDIENVRNEWPRATLDPDRDLKAYEAALRLYERDDYMSMMQCASMLAPAIAHSLYGPGILQGDALPDAVHKTLYCAGVAPPDNRTFAESAQKAARLALTVMRENGWQPPSVGGTNPHFEAMLSGDYLLFTEAISPSGRPWEGDLKKFFAVPPQTGVGILPKYDADASTEALRRVESNLERAEQGDAGSTAYLEGLRLALAGDELLAVNQYKDAAALGSIDAMIELATHTAGNGQDIDSAFWWEAAANAGNALGMFNTGINKISAGDRQAATRWFQLAGEAGNPEGYAALTQLADEAGDDTAEKHWSRLGAEAGHLFCMSRYGLLLARSADGNVVTLRKAREILEQAAERGQLDAACLAVSVNHQLDDGARAQRFVGLVLQSGDHESIDQLRRFGIL